MIDETLLKTLGWSEELIRTAGQVAGVVASAAVLGSTVVGVEIDLSTAAAATEASQKADVSGPPVAQAQLLVRSK